MKSKNCKSYFQSLSRRIFLVFFICFLFLLGFKPRLDSQEAQSQQKPEVKTIEEIKKEIENQLREIEELATSFVEEKRHQEALEGSEPALTSLSAGQEIEKPASFSNRISLNFNQADIEDVFRVIGEAGNLNIIIDPLVKGRRLDIYLKDVNVGEALDIIMNSYGLGYSQIGGCLFISTEEKTKQKAVITQMFKLKNIPADKAKDMVKNMVESVEANSEINCLIVKGLPQQIRKTEELIIQMDRPQPQVLIKAEIIEVDTGALKELGIDWPDNLSLSFQETTRPISLGSTVSLINPDSPFRAYRLERSAFNFITILKLLEKADRAKVLSSPKATTMNNKEAQIFVGDKIPYTVTLITGGTTTTEVRFVESGIRLKITPSVIEDDFVVVSVKPEVSYIYGWRGPQDQYPWVKSREASASVRIANKETFMLGGLLSSEDKKSIFSIPFFSKAPFVGKLFSYEKKEHISSDIVILITPEVIR